MSGIVQAVDNRLKYADGGVGRDEITTEFGITEERASEVLRSLRYRGRAKFQFSDGQFYHTADQGVSR